MADMCKTFGKLSSHRNNDEKRSVFDIKITAIVAIFGKKSILILILKMADLEKLVFGFEHHHFAIFLKYFVPEIFEIILYIHFSLLELGQFTYRVFHHKV